MSEDKANGKVPFYLSRKFWMEVVAAGVFLALALTETVTFTSQEVMIFVLGLAGIAVGGHALTDVGAMISQAIAGRFGGAPQPAPAVEPKPEPEAESEPEEEETEVEVDDSDEEE